MAKLSLRTWIHNAAAVFSGQHGAVTCQAEQAGCSRETVYQHARKLEQRLTTESAALAELHAENRRLGNGSPSWSGSLKARFGATRSSDANWPPPPSPWG